MSRKQEQEIASLKRQLERYKNLGQDLKVLEEIKTDIVVEKADLLIKKKELIDKLINFIDKLPNEKVEMFNNAVRLLRKGHDKAINKIVNEYMFTINK